MNYFSYFSQKDEIKKVKIAAPCDDDNNVDQHFDKAKKICIYEMEDNKLINKTYINSSKDMWIKKENNYMILTSDTSEIIDSSNSACIKTYLKLKNIGFYQIT